MLVLQIFVDLSPLVAMTAKGGANPQDRWYRVVVLFEDP
jgi:hypothetical protein